MPDSITSFGLFSRVDFLPTVPYKGALHHGPNAALQKRPPCDVLLAADRRGARPCRPQRSREDTPSMVTSWEGDTQPGWWNSAVRLARSVDAMSDGRLRITV